MKKLVKRTQVTTNSVKAFGASCSCSCPSCKKWYTNSKSGVKDINKVMNA